MSKSSLEILFGKFLQFNREKQEVILGDYNVTATPEFDFKICYTKKLFKNDTPWQAENTLVMSLPVLVMQIIISIVLTRILVFLFKPLRQQRFVAETIAGIIMGPTVIGGFSFSLKIFPFEATRLYEAVSNLSLTYYMFLAGLEIDLSSLKRMGKKPLIISIAGIIIPFCIGTGLYYYPLEIGGTSKSFSIPNPSNKFGSTIWAITLTVTSFSDLARILSDVKLLHTDIGRIALSSAIVNDLSAWVLIVVVIISLNGSKFYLVAIPTLAFIAICWFVLRPAIASWLRRMKKDGKKFTDMHVHLVICGVCLFGFITDFCGSHSMVGGFMLGLLLPQGEFAMKIMERTEEYVNGIMMPTFYFTVGYRTNFIFLRNKMRASAIVLVVLLATSAKVVSTYLVSFYLRISSTDALALGTLLNTKGVFALVVINKGRGMKAIDTLEMPILICIVVFMTCLVGPIFIYANKKVNSSRRHKRRSIQESNPDTELRFLTCVHSSRNVSGMISILEISNATRKSPIGVFVVHLVELTGRASAMLIVHDVHRTTNNNLGYEKPGTDQILSAFEKYKMRNDSVLVQPLTAVSPYSTMHEDIFNLAKDKRVSMIIVPFHKQPTSTRELVEDNLNIQEVNQNLLVNAPCSVGILVDRGLGLSDTCSNPLSSDSGKKGLRLGVLFISGPDDHEALSYAWRMVGTPGLTLTVVRFLPVEDGQPENNLDENMSEIVSESKIEKMLDDEFINEFRFKTMCNDSITYLEKQVSNVVELTQCIRTMYNEYDLYIVGRGENVKSPLTMGLSEFSENPELGPIGEALISTEFTSHASVLVVQQCDPGDQFRAMRSQHHNSKFGQKKWASPILNPEYEAFINSKNN